MKYENFKRAQELVNLINIGKKELEWLAKTITNNNYYTLSVTLFEYSNPTPLNLHIEKEILEDLVVKLSSKINRDIREYEKELETL